MITNIIFRRSDSPITSDKPHYENLLPEGWTITTLGEIFQHNNGKQKSSSNKEGRLLKYITTSNVYWGEFDLSNVKEMFFTNNELEKCTVTKGDLLVCEGGDVGRSAIWNYEYPICIQNHLHRLRSWLPVCTEYFFYSLMYNKFKNLIKGKGIGLMSLSSNDLHNIPINLPPVNEQKRIVAEINRWFDLFKSIENNTDNLNTLIKTTKSKVLDLAIHGKLVPQEPTDEPATELLKRINPNAEITCDNGHYQKLPEGWTVCQLDNIVIYEQPTPYILKSTDYKDSYPTPVLTAGESFIIGYTNETNGIYDKLPCIIFDDFTTDSKLVDFPFKVKSSAMKILQVKEDINIEYIAMFMSITRLIGDTHKRYWISEYSKIEIPIPPQNEQDRIVKKVRLLLSRLDEIMENL